MHVRTRTWFSFVAVAALLLIAGSRFAFLAPLENAALTLAAPVESALRDATRPAADFVNNLTDVNRLSSENQALLEENERQATEIVALREAEREYQELQQLVDIRRPGDDEVFIAADVFAHDASNLNDRIALNSGSADGLREGMIVLTAQGSLVGSITRVLDDSAWVTLITDQTSAVSAFIQESRVQGVVAGAPDGTLTMEFVDETADVKVGDFVLTSGVGGNHPQGEIIGQVVDVQEAGSGLFQSVRVQPLADLSRLERVLVLASFLPVDEIAP